MPLGGERRERQQQAGEEEIGERHTPGLGRALQGGGFVRIDAKVREPVVRALLPPVSGTKRAARRRDELREVQHASGGYRRMTQEKSAIGPRVEVRRRRGRRCSGARLRDRVEQEGDRFAAGNEMVVGKAQMERLRVRSPRRSGTDSGVMRAENGRLSCRSISRQTTPSGSTPPGRTSRITSAGPTCVIERRRRRSSTRPVSPCASSTRPIRSATGTSPKGWGTTTTCTALYGCMSRHRSIIRWKRLSRPGTQWPVVLNGPTARAPVSPGSVAAPPGTSAFSRCTRCRPRAGCCACRRCRRREAGRAARAANRR